MYDSKNSPLTRLLQGLLIAALCLGFTLRAEPVRNGAVSVELLADQNTAHPGDLVTVGLRVTMDEGWHTYWLNGGDTGFATSVKWDLPAGVIVYPLRWPTPDRFIVGAGGAAMPETPAAPAPFAPRKGGGFGEDPPAVDAPADPAAAAAEPEQGIVSYGYHHEVIALTEVYIPSDAAPGTTLTLKGLATWLMCDQVCIPGRAEISLAIPVIAGSVGTTNVPADSEALQLAAEKIPAVAEKAGWQVAYTASDLGLSLVATPGPDALQLPPDATVRYIPLRKRTIDDLAPQTLTRYDDGSLSLFVPWHERVGELPTSAAGLLVASAPWATRAQVPAGDLLALSFDTAPPGTDPAAAASPAAATSSAASAALPVADRGLLVYLVLAFAGGMILNLMPCVLPVLSIKILSFVEQAKDTRHSPMAHGLAYTIGVVGSFVALALSLHLIQAALSTKLAWGAQFQSPYFMAFLVPLLFLLGLSLFGVFEVGTSLTTVGASGGGHSGLLGSFMTGLLATIVATPCAAPFMGAAVGWAWTQPLPTKLLVFFALGLGMALPYLLLAAFPQLLRYVPKPGPWMETMKQFFGFCMMGTVVWLLWVLGAQVGRDGMAVFLVILVIVGFGGWVYGRWDTFLATPRVRWTARLVFLATLVLGIALGILAAGSDALRPTKALVATEDGFVSHGITWTTFSPEAVDTQRAAGRIVFIDFTADWCTSCQWNETWAFTAKVSDAFTAANVAPMVADFTNADPVITEALASFGRSSVPLYVFYSPDSSVPPVLLEGFLTQGDLLKALARIQAATAGKTADRS